MFPSHLSVTDLGVFAVAVVFGLVVVLLSLFDFVSTLRYSSAFCSARDIHLLTIPSWKRVKLEKIGAVVKIFTVPWFCCKNSMLNCRNTRIPTE